MCCGRERPVTAISAGEDGGFGVDSVVSVAAAGGTFLSLNKKVPKEVSKGESVVCLAPAMQATLPLDPLPAALLRVRFAFRRFRGVPSQGGYRLYAARKRKVFVVGAAKRRPKSLPF